jgi:hypothetical protein
VARERWRALAAKQVVVAPAVSAAEHCLAEPCASPETVAALDEPRAAVLGARWEPAPADAVVPPDEAAVPPDAGVVAPDAGVVPPDAGVVPPDAGVVPPDAGVVPPDAAAAHAARVSFPAQSPERLGRAYRRAPARPTLAEPAA